jgi:hypothetical protein
VPKIVHSGKASPSAVLTLPRVPLPRHSGKPFFLLFCVNKSYTHNHKITNQQQYITNHIYELTNNKSINIPCSAFNHLSAFSLALNIRQMNKMKKKTTQVTISGSPTKKNLCVVENKVDPIFQWFICVVLQNSVQNLPKHDSKWRKNTYPKLMNKSHQG